MSQAKSRNVSGGLALATLLWVAGVAFGLVVLWNYELAPSPLADPPDQWPRDSSIARADGLATLVVFAHPRCPCTRATLDELERIMARRRDKVHARVVFMKPDGTDSDWERTDLWTWAERIPGVQVSVDAGGIEAQRFSAKTSGQAMLYDAQGTLLFQGGITPSRGHSGDNDGRSAITAHLMGERNDPAKALVFGCRLSNDSRDECQEEGSP